MTPKAIAPGSLLDLAEEVDDGRIRTGPGSHASHEAPADLRPAGSDPSRLADKPFAVFGDWRDLRGALEEIDPTWKDLPEAERAAQWEFATKLIGAYAPMKARCCNCREIVHARSAYRCADCHGHFCESCIRPHFGPNHKPHGDRR